MQTTFLDTPVLRDVLRGLAGGFLRLSGWRLEGELPTARRYVVIVAPHTSNWDFVIGLALVLHYRLRIYWMGKHTLFVFPFGPVMRWLGGLPVDRSKSGGLVDATIEAFRSHPELAIAIAPEGTRRKVSQWRTGFYWIAHGAGVPILPGYIDYRTKRAGFGAPFTTSGDIDGDLVKLKAYYHDVTGRY